ncbi:MAG: MFS transporter [Alcaligenaceae bacterium]|nr:MFS transporter [Alcaligenaceae bacterium]
MTPTHTKKHKRDLIWFPLALVIFEFAVYIGNDLVQPAMLTITREFRVDDSWVASSMSLYILGGAILMWLIGPLSDRYGRRKVMLAGTLYYAVTNLLILFSFNIESFMLMRLLQGISHCFIGAVGYVSIQESFRETTAIKVMAIMANIALIAPLLGPLAGAAIISYVSWHWGFILIAGITCLSLIGLYRHMPETVDLAAPKEPMASIWAHYKTTLRNRNFIQLALFSPIIGLPMLVWIGLSPVFLIKDLGLSNMGYAQAQIPIFACLILGNVILARVSGKVPVGQTVYYALPLVVSGGLCLLLAGLIPAFALTGLILGMSLLALSQGLSFAVLYRLTLLSSQAPKGVVAAAMSLIMMLMSAISIELFKWLYVIAHLPWLCIACATLAAIYALLTTPVMRLAMRKPGHNG